MAVRAADPTAQELHFLYEVNRARHDPPAWAAEYGLGSQTGGDGLPTTLIGVDPRPPLALNTTLVNSARYKAQEMAINNYFGHQSDGRPQLLLAERAGAQRLRLPAGGDRARSVHPELLRAQ